jgi:hypothetical protein
MRIIHPRTVYTARPFLTSAQHYKTVTERVKDAAKTVDRTASQAAIKGLEGLEKVSEVTKDTPEKIGIKTEQAADDLEVKGKAVATKTEVKGEHVKGDAKQGVREGADKVKDATR